MEQIIIIGCSGHGRVVSDIIQKQGRYEILGYVDDLPSMAENTYDYPLLGKICHLPALLAGREVSAGIVAIGDNWSRGKVVDEVRRLHPGFKFITAIHPSAQIGPSVTIGQGTVVMAGAVINGRSNVGDFCIINTHSSLDHDCKMGPFASLAPGSTVGGVVEIGEYSAVCLGASVIHNIQIGANSVVGAGAVVTQDLTENIVAVGVPARPIRSRKPDERYL